MPEHRRNYLLGVSPNKASQLSELDIRSTTWLKLVEIIDARINVLRKKNDNNMTPEETSTVRGQIKECKRFLALAKKAPPQETDDS